MVRKLALGSVLTVRVHVIHGTLQQSRTNGYKVRKKALIEVYKLVIRRRLRYHSNLRFVGALGRSQAVTVSGE